MTYWYTWLTHSICRACRSRVIWLIYTWLTHSICRACRSRAIWLIYTRYTTYWYTWLTHVEWHIGISRVTHDSLMLSDIWTTYSTYWYTWLTHVEWYVNDLFDLLIYMTHSCWVTHMNQSCHARLTHVEGHIWTTYLTYWYTWLTHVEWHKWISRVTQANETRATIQASLVTQTNENINESCHTNE